MNITFVPELDDGRELKPKDIALCQEIVRMLRWATKLGRVDILHEISIPSQCQASPRENHMKQSLKNLQSFREEMQIDPLCGSQSSSR